jgi:hypothetical protein
MHRVRTCWICGRSSDSEGKLQYTLKCVEIVAAGERALQQQAARDAEHEWKGGRQPQQNDAAAPRTPDDQRAFDFCTACGAHIPPIMGEGTCGVCNPTARTPLSPFDPDAKKTQRDDLR